MSKPPRRLLRVVRKSTPIVPAKKEKTYPHKARRAKSDLRRRPANHLARGGPSLARDWDRSELPFN